MVRDTHGSVGRPWVGFDLDGTLAQYDGWKGISHIGEPIQPIVDRMIELHDAGVKVKILTARVAPRDEFGGEQYDEVDDVRVYAHDYIARWCSENIGFVPEIVHTKDHLMTALFDDRVVQVEPNTGKILGADITI